MPQGLTVVSTTHSQSLNILIVEDDANLRESIIDALRGRGYHVRGIDCAEALPEQNDLLQLDLAILDVNLPDESGLSLAKRMRAVQPELGIIILSARSSADDRTAGYAHGADIYLTKPASLNELDEAVLALARRLRPEPKTPDSLGLKLHAASLSLTCQGQPIALTKNEATLLAAWARAPQNTLEHWQIAEALGMEDGVKKPLIELHVSRLRKKLPTALDVPTSIRAIRGQGYQLCVPLVLT